MGGRREEAARSVFDHHNNTKEKRKKGGGKNTISQGESLPTSGKYQQATPATPPLSRPQPKNHKPHHPSEYIAPSLQTAQSVHRADPVQEQ